MHILFFSHFKVYPPNHGAVRRVWSLASSLSRLGIQVSILCNHKTDLAQEKQGVSIVCVKRPPTTGLIPFEDQNNLRMLKKFFQIERMKPVDIVQCEFPYLSPIAAIAKVLHKPIVLDEHGVEVDFYRTIGFGKSVGKPISKTMLAATYQVEKFALKICSLAFTCSAVDSARIQELYGVAEEKIRVVPNAADPAFFEPIKPHDFSRPTVLFTGSVLHPPNEFAIRVLTKKIIPLVQRRMREALFVFIGKDPPNYLSGNNILALGEVEDVRPYTVGADVCVAPIYHGSGTRTKILEFMACRRPVVSTTKGVEGIDGVENEKNILIRDTPGEFSEAILRLLQDHRTAGKIAEAGYLLAKERYDWRKVADRALQFYRELL